MVRRNRSAAVAYPLGRPVAPALMARDFRHAKRGRKLRLPAILSLLDQHLRRHLRTVPLQAHQPSSPPPRCERFQQVSPRGLIGDTHRATRIPCPYLPGRKKLCNDRPRARVAFACRAVNQGQRGGVGLRREHRTDSASHHCRAPRQRRCCWRRSLSSRTSCVAYDYDCVVAVT